MTCSFALIAANRYSSGFCDDLPSNYKMTFCTFPTVIMALDIVLLYMLWWVPGADYCSGFTCVTLPYEIYYWRKGKAAEAAPFAEAPPPAATEETAQAKKEEAPGKTDSQPASKWSRSSCRCNNAFPILMRPAPIFVAINRGTIMFYWVVYLRVLNENNCHYFFHKVVSILERSVLNIVGTSWWTHFVDIPQPILPPLLPSYVILGLRQLSCTKHFPLRSVLLQYVKLS